MLYSISSRDEKTSEFRQGAGNGLGAMVDECKTLSFFSSFVFHNLFLLFPSGEEERGFW